MTTEKIIPRRYRRCTCGARFDELDWNWCPVCGRRYWRDRTRVESLDYQNPEGNCLYDVISASAGLRSGKARRRRRKARNDLYRLHPDLAREQPGHWEITEPRRYEPEWSGWRIEGYHGLYPIREGEPVGWAPWPPSPQIVGAVCRLAFVEPGSDLANRLWLDIGGILQYCLPVACDRVDSPGRPKGADIGRQIAAVELSRLHLVRLNQVARQEPDRLLELESNRPWKELSYPEGCTVRWGWIQERLVNGLAFIELLLWATWGVNARAVLTALRGSRRGNDYWCSQGQARRLLLQRTLREKNDTPRSLFFPAFWVPDPLT